MSSARIAPSPSDEAKARKSTPVFWYERSVPLNVAGTLTARQARERRDAGAQLLDRARAIPRRRSRPAWRATRGAPAPAATGSRAARRRRSRGRGRRTPRRSRSSSALVSRRTQPEGRRTNLPVARRRSARSSSLSTRSSLSHCAVTPNQSTPEGRTEMRARTERPPSSSRCAREVANQRTSSGRVPQASSNCARRRAVSRISQPRLPGARAGARQPLDRGRERGRVEHVELRGGRAGSGAGGGRDLDRQPAARRAVLVDARVGHGVVARRPRRVGGGGEQAQHQQVVVAVGQVERDDRASRDDAQVRRQRLAHRGEALRQVVEQRPMPRRIDGQSAEREQVVDQVDRRRRRPRGAPRRRRTGGRGARARRGARRARGTPRAAGDGCRRASAPRARAPACRPRPSSSWARSARRAGPAAPCRPGVRPQRSAIAGSSAVDQVTAGVPPPTSSRRRTALVVATLPLP